MSLEKLTLRNFQAHEKIVIEFDPNITTIVGASDVGKSAIIRALSWVLCNQPSGEAFIKHGEDCVRVSLRLDGDQLIIRERGKENLYKLENGFEKDLNLPRAIHEFKAFGSNVPDAIKDLLKVSEINIQRQFDSPFWFAESSGEVSRRLNEIVNLGVIDDALGKVAAQLRKARERVEISTERVKELEEKASSFAFVEAFSAQVSLCASLQKEVLETQQNKLRLMILGNQAAGYRKSLKEIEKFSNNAQGSLLFGGMLEKKSDKVIRLFQFIATAEEQSRKALFEAPNLIRFEKAIEEIQKKEIRWNLLREWLIELNFQLSQKKKLFGELQIAHDNLHSQFKNCPLCDQPLPDV